MTVSYEQKGGARLGWLSASWPFARLSASRESLRLSCPGRDYVFPRSSIRKLSRHRGIFSVGLRIEQRDEVAPEFIVFWASVFFWSSGFRKLRAHLEGLGYEIQR